MRFHDVAGASDTGLVRHNNEDAILVDKAAGLFAVADGMGGHGQGDVASNLAVTQLLGFLHDTHTRSEHAADVHPEEQYTNLMYRAIEFVNSHIFKRNLDDGHSDGNGMGTTLVGLQHIPDSDIAISFNVGDSRLYKLANGQLTQLTTDHSMLNDWIQNGRIGPEPPANIILRALGLFPQIEIDLHVLQLEPGTSFLLCSDGLSSMVSENVVASALDNKQADATEQCRTLIDMANQAGGHDNISVVLLKC